MEQRFVSKTIIPSAKPPKRQNTIWSWLKDNLFSTPTNTVISIVLGCLLIDLLIPLVNWMFINA
ncbi:MAG: amino acid ABC transporter permease, partial [Bartonella sp.]|nr:amino acid ABC transporter permease [Bartonella sp.]